jgi:hypothetical protein
MEGNGGGGFLSWEQVAAALRHDIISGVIPPGVMLASREVRAGHGCTTQAARKAMRALEDEGLLRNRQSATWRTGTADPAADVRMGATLARLRQAAGLDASALATTAGLHPGHVADAESGTWQPRGIWERLDAALGADGTLLKLHDNAYAPRPGHPNIPVAMASPGGTSRPCPAGTRQPTLPGPTPTGGSPLRSVPGSPAASGRPAPGCASSPWPTSTALTSAPSVRPFSTWPSRA